MHGDLFYLKKVLNELLYPENMSILVLALGIIWLLRQKYIAGLWLCVSGLILFILPWLPITGFLLIRSLEDKAGPPANPQEIIGKGIRQIVVLQDEVEAADLWQRIPGSKLIVSTGFCGTQLLEKARAIAESEDLVNL